MFGAPSANCLVLRLIWIGRAAKGLRETQIVYYCREQVLRQNCTGRAAKRSRREAKMFGAPTANCLVPWQTWTGRATKRLREKQMV